MARSDTAGIDSALSAHLGRPRRRRVDDTDEVVRVELRLPRHIALVLFERANESGRTVSRVGGDAIWHVLTAEERPM